MGNVHLFTMVNAILLSAYVASICAQDSELQGRLLTPEEGCGISKVANTKIVGGVPAKNGAFPWMTILGYKMNKFLASFECGGTLITSRHVLTAAHCLRPNLTFVRLAEYDLSTMMDGPHLNVPVHRAVPHPNYDDTDKTNDIAILTLERDVEFTDRIRPICLPLTKELQNKSFVGENPFVAGWGLLKENGPRSSVLMQVQLPILNNASCEWRYKLFGKKTSEKQFSDLVLCAGNLAGGQDTCQGDSGGPLMLPIHKNGQFPMYQIGIISWGLGCGRANKPGVYTRVSSVIDWINEQVNISVSSQ